MTIKNFRYKIVDGRVSVIYVKYLRGKVLSFKIKKHKPQVTLGIRKQESIHQP